MVTPKALAAAFYERYRLMQGDRRERLAADEYAWSSEAVSAAIERNDDDLLATLDALLTVPQADAAYLAYIGAGPLEDLLTMHGAGWSDAVAERCRQSSAWRQAVSGVYIDDPAGARLSALESYLPGA